MATWSKNNRACTTTWLTLHLLDQLDKVFKYSGTIAMPDLTYWNPTASAEMRKVQASTLAHEIDNMFTNARCAQYEEGVTSSVAVNDMISVLVDENKTVADLAATADEDYLFWEENNNE